MSGDKIKNQIENGPKKRKEKQIYWITVWFKEEKRQRKLNCKKKVKVMNVRTISLNSAYSELSHK